MIPTVVQKEPTKFCTCPQDKAGVPDRDCTQWDGYLVGYIIALAEQDFGQLNLTFDREYVSKLTEDWLMQAVARVPGGKEYWDKRLTEVGSRQTTAMWENLQNRVYKAFRWDSKQSWKGKNHQGIGPEHPLQHDYSSPRLKGYCDAMSKVRITC